jgi:hypothetical protein
VSIDHSLYDLGEKIRDGWRDRKRSGHPILLLLVVADEAHAGHGAAWQPGAHIKGV